MLGTIGLLVLVAALVARARWRSDADDNGWLPAQLRGAQLAYAEKTFRSRKHKIVARLDRAYRHQGSIHLMEFKTRKVHRTYRSDVIELSAQRVALEADTGERVNEKAWVVTQVGQERRVHQVDLLGVEQVDALRRRRRGILTGSIQPEFAEHAAPCRNCAFYQRECRPGNVPQDRP